MRDGSDVRDRVALGLRSAWLRQAAWTGLGAVARFDGILVALTGLPDPTMNVGFVESPPSEPGAALEAADAWFEARGQRIGLDLERGRDPAVERAAARLGLSPAVTRPGMARAIGGVITDPPPPGLSIRTVRDPIDLEAARTLQREVFGLLPEVATGFLPPVTLRTPGFRLLLATLHGQPVGSAAVHLDHGAAGILGVSTLLPARRRGVGTALTEGCLAHVRRRGVRPRLAPVGARGQNQLRAPRLRGRLGLGGLDPLTVPAYRVDSTRFFNPSRACFTICLWACFFRNPGTGTSRSTSSR